MNSIITQGYADPGTRNNHLMSRHFLRDTPAVLGESRLVGVRVYNSDSSDSDWGTEKYGIDVINIYVLF